jgi:hypothetical protein
MRILLLSDLHGRIKGLQELGGLTGPVDMIIASGDLTHFGNPADAFRVVEELKKINPTLLAVAGNCDSREVEALLMREGLAPDREGFEVGGCRFFGLGGALPGPVRTPYERSEEELETGLSAMKPGSAEEVLVLVSHQPPYGTVADRVMRLKHVGSRSVSAWIKKNKPALVVCGHIHESRGHKIEGKSLVVNPGAFKDGCYAVADLDCLSGEVKIREGKISGV